MQFIKLLFIGWIGSQIFFLGAFGLDTHQYFVINEDTNMCGVFTRGNTQSPNWLPQGWEAIKLHPSLNTRFQATISCKNSQVNICCSELGYKIAGIAIGQEKVDELRSSAEFLGSKKIIQSQSLSPSKYQLETNISRKELMKVIIGASEKIPQPQCKGLFLDVKNDWGCKYIELALENAFIEGNNNFRPDDNVSKVEALKLIFQARSIPKSYNTLYWQEDYIATAYYLGFLDEKFKDYNSPATRGWIFQVLARSYKEYSFTK